MLADPKQGYSRIGENVRCSLVLPVYNEEEKIERCIIQLKKILEPTILNYELIVVNDGSTDRTLEIIKKLSNNIPQLKIISYSENRGKGHAVKVGVDNTCGNDVIYIDGDLDISPNTVLKYFSELSNYDLVIGSKRHQHSNVNWPHSRRILSKLFNCVVRCFTGTRVTDTQCGMKAAKGPILRKLFQFMLVKRYAFDAELLTIASLLDFKIKEMPVDITIDCRFEIKSILKMFIDILAISYRLRIKKYYQKQILLNKQLIDSKLKIMEVNPN